MDKKNKLALEKQVCTRKQAKELSELLGKHAPESLWRWHDWDCEKWELVEAEAMF